MYGPPVDRYQTRSQGDDPMQEELAVPETPEVVAPEEG